MVDKTDENKYDRIDILWESGKEILNKYGLRPYYVR